MPNNWKTYKLEDVLDALIDYRGKTPKKTTSGIPLVTAKIVKQGRILEPSEFIAEEDYERWMVRGLPEVGDVVLTTEAPLGEVAQIKDNSIALAQRIVTLRGKGKVLDSTYLKYFLQSKEGQRRLVARESGTTVTGIKQSELRKVEIDCPPYLEQRAIASILSSLDDKIELNLQTNKTLEEMAMTLYKHWFVDFGPFKDGKFVDSVLGRIPEGWEVKKFGEIVQNRKESVSVKSINDSDKYIGLEHLQRGALSILEYGLGSDVSSNKSKFEKGDILFGKLRPYFKKVGIAPYNGICSTDILVITPSEQRLFGFALLTIFNDRFIEYTTNVSGGTRMPRVSWGSIEDYEVPFCTSESIVGEFNSQLEAFSDQILESIKETEILTNLRETLLPKLISGEVRVKDAEQTLSEVL